MGDKILLISFFFLFVCFVFLTNNGGGGAKVFKKNDLNYASDGIYGLISKLSYFVECETDYFLAHGRVDFSEVETVYGQKVFVTCEEGYEVEGDSVITCLASGEWSTTVCQPMPAGICIIGPINTRTGNYSAKYLFYRYDDVMAMILPVTGFRLECAKISLKK